MKNIPYGRIVFGLSAVLFGIIAIMWHDADTWQGLYRILKWPFGNYIGDVLMVVLIAGGLALLVPRTVEVAEKMLAVVLGFTILVCIPSLFKAPTNIGAWYPLAEQAAMFCAVIVSYAQRSARIVLGLATIVFTLGQWIFFKNTADLVPAWIPLGATFWTVATTVAFGLAAIALLMNVQTKLAAWLMGLMVALFGLLVWVPIVATHPSNHNDWSEFAINFLITGAAWLVSDYNGHESRSRS
jgi:uncharacterized membrane protein